MRDPCSSRQTTLHPVLNPGSIASVALGPRGEASKSCLRFSENTSMASLSALSFELLKNSVSIDGDNNLLIFNC